MPTITLTETLRSTIKDLRKKKKKRGDELSKELGKGAAYISQVENGKIKEIDFDLLNDIFRKITDMSESQYNDFLDNLLNDTVSHMTEEELQHEKWVHQFNHEIRKYPIPDSLIEFIKDKLSKLNYTPEQFVEVINENRGLDGEEIKETNKLDIDIMDTGNGSYRIISSIRFDLPRDFISKILSKEMKTINYVNMQGILFNLFLSENSSAEEAHKKSEELLYENQFYTIRERNKIIKKNLKEKNDKNESFTFYDVQPTDYDKEYTKLKNDIGNGFDYLRDRNIVYACDHLESLLKNMREDLPLITVIMSAPLFKIDKDQRKAFWEDYQKLVMSYMKNESDDNPI